MATQELHRQIESRLKHLLDLQTEMQQHASSIPYAEIDLFLQKVRQLYEASLLLHHHNALRTMEELEAAIAERYARQTEAVKVASIGTDNNRISQVETVSEIQNTTVIPEQEKPVVQVIAATPKEVIKEEKPEITLPPAAEKTIRQEVSPVQQAIQELISDRGIKQDPESATQSIPKTKKISGDLHEMFDEVPTLAGKFEEHETLGERIATSATPTRVGEKMQRKAVKDLKAAIGLNEKFQFINQLFGGDAGTYHHSIELLNSCASVDAAKNYVNSTLQPKYQWDMNSSPVTLFIDLVERRFLT